MGTTSEQGRALIALMQSLIRKLASSACAALLVVSSASAAAQGRVAPVALTGTVIEAVSGAPVPGAHVRLLDAQGTERATATTDERGQFRLAVPAPGKYTVGADRIGFRRQDGAPLVVETGAGALTPMVLTLTQIPVLLDSIRTQAYRDFSGAWKLVRTSAKRSDGAQPLVTIFVEQDANTFKLYRRLSLTEDKGGFDQIICNLDGTPSTRLASGFEHRCVLGWDGPTLVLLVQRLDPDPRTGPRLSTDTIHVRLTVAADAKSLTMRSDNKYTRRSRDGPYVFDTYQRP